MSKSNGLLIIICCSVVGCSLFRLDNAPAAPIAAPNVVDGFDYPVGMPTSQGGKGYVSAANDGDGYYNAQNFIENGHCGEDWNGEGGGNTDYGDPVYAVANGIVTAAGDYGSSWGNIVTIEHYMKGVADPNYEIVESQYAHLSVMNVSVGDQVSRGQKIGEIGDANGTYYAHLHFELRWDEKAGATSNGGYWCFQSEDAAAKGWINPSDFIDSTRNFP